MQSLPFGRSEFVFKMDIQTKKSVVHTPRRYRRLVSISGAELRDDCQIIKKWRRVSRLARDQTCLGVPLQIGESLELRQYWRIRESTHDRVFH